MRQLAARFRPLILVLLTVLLGACSGEAGPPEAASEGASQTAGSDYEAAGDASDEEESLEGEEDDVDTSEATVGEGESDADDGGEDSRDAKEKRNQDHPEAYEANRG